MFCERLHVMVTLFWSSFWFGQSTGPKLVETIHRPGTNDGKNYSRAFWGSRYMGPTLMTGQITTGLLRAVHGPDTNEGTNYSRATWSSTSTYGPDTNDADGTNYSRAS
uniref:Secreted protein n=1 Tax=Cacopsylla melanoneura TaxID=428564 RepID=A0A8D8ZBM6_9HEMI